jgi:hypothetical protein
MIPGADTVRGTAMAEARTFQVVLNVSRIFLIAVMALLPVAAGRIPNAQCGFTSEVNRGFPVLAFPTDDRRMLGKVSTKCVIRRSGKRCSSEPLAVQR